MQIPRMCGRYGFGNPARLSELPFGVALPELVARFNLTPSQDVPLIRETKRGRDAAMVRWGLVPHWAEDKSIGNRLVNARGDTAATKPAFRDAFAERRGLLPADLFYEWQEQAGHDVRQPWCVRLPEQAPFAFGALWERWRPRGDPDAAWLVTCAIITTEPNAVLRPIHDRMPVIVEPHDYARWLDPSTSLKVAQSLVKPYAGTMEAWPVSLRVNNPRVDDAACIVPLS